MPRVFAYIPQKAGVLDDGAAELVAVAKKLAPSVAPVAVVAGYGPELESACCSLSAWYAEIWKVNHRVLAYPNAELIRTALVEILPKGCVVLVPHNHFGIDLSPGLSVKMNGTFVSDVVNLEASRDGTLKIVRQEFGGQISTHVSCDISSGAVLNIRPGAFSPVEAQPANVQVVDKTADIGALIAKRRYVKTIAADASGVDISKEPVLVSIGRGIQEKDNVVIAEALAEAMGAVVSCSRPVVDAKWLEKSRQVGTSGKTVKPKVYIACGISGSFQHLAGIKGNPFLVAINKNPRAPIFQVADVGIVDDLLKFLPELTVQIRESYVKAAAGQ